MQGWGSPCNPEKLRICPFKEGGPVQRASNGCVFFLHEKVLQPHPGSSEGAEVACAH